MPYVVEWPVIERADSSVPRAVPDVTGRSLRDAARVLHQAGLRVRVDGWGVVHSLDPEPGTTVAPGTVVTVRAVERRSR